MWIDQENKAKEGSLALQAFQYSMAETACQACNAASQLYGPTGLSAFVTVPPSLKRHVRMTC